MFIYSIYIVSYLTEVIVITRMIN